MKHLGILLPALTFLLWCSAALAQPVANTNTNWQPQITYAVLPGGGYTFTDVLARKNLPFVPQATITLANDSFYWIKINIANPVHFSGRYALWASPDMANTFYYFDANTQTWLSQTAGMVLPGGAAIVDGFAQNLTMQPKDTNIVYLKTSTAELKPFGATVRPIIEFKTEAAIDASNLIETVAWAATVSVLFFFLIINLYLYISFRDKPVLYYLLIQLGGMVYVTSYRPFFSLITTAYKLMPNGQVFEYGTADLVQHAGIMLVVLGITNFARFYLNTPKQLPRMDALLKGALLFYMAVSVVLMAINAAGLLLEPYTLLGDNAFLLLFMVLILTMVFTCYRRKVKGAGTFLLAYTFPLYIVIAITLFHIFITMGETINWGANLAVVSEAFGFSAALVARTKLILNNLKAKELEAQQLAFDIKELALQHSVVELENQKITLSIQHEKTRNELLQQKLEANQRELASTTLYMVQKNELLATLKAEIEELNKQHPGGKLSEISSVKSILQSNEFLDNDWNRFRLHFEQVHPHFFEELAAKHPTLTKNEIRLCAYFHINLSTKEIAALLNIAPASVRRAKTRLFKKMGQAHLLAPDEVADEDA